MSKQLKINSPLILAILIVILTTACKSKRKIVNTSPKAVVEAKNSDELRTIIKQNEFKFDYLSAKYSVDADIDSSRSSFNVSMRVRKDSLIWLSISPAIGIEVARAVISKDSVKFIDRMHSKYFKGDFNYINRLLHADLDYEMIQSLLVGNSVDFYEEKDKMRSYNEGGNYVLSTIRKRKLKKVIERNRELKDPAQTIWLSPSNLKIVRLLFNDFDSNRSFDAKYDTYQMVDSVYFPAKVNYLIKAEKNITISIDYSKVSINKFQTFSFSIPEKYEQIIYQEKK